MATRKDHPENTTAGRQAKANAEAGVADVAAEVQERMDAETTQGFRGVEVDPTPNDHYTVAGVTSGQPTPETDADAAAKARAHASETRRLGDGPGVE